MTSRILLSDGLPFVVSRALIHAVGLEQALVLQQIHYWCDPKRNQNHFHGKYWVHNTYKQWQKQFSFWNLKKIQRVFNTLERYGLLVSFIQQTNCHKTKFYTINYERLSSMRETLGFSSCPENGVMVTPKLVGSRDRIGCIDDPKSVLSYKLITETTYRDNPPLTPPSPSRQEEEEKSEMDQIEKSSESTLFQQMVDVWNDAVQSRLHAGSQALLTSQRSQKMAVFLKETTVCDLVAWEGYCEKIRASRFLMGENSSGFRVTLDWALNPANARKILEGAIYDKPQESKASEGTFIQKPWAEYASFLKQHCEIHGYSDRWFEACKVLATVLGQATFENWFKEMAPEEKDENLLHLNVKSAFLRDYIRTHHETALQKAIQAAYPAKTRFEIRVGTDPPALKRALPATRVDQAGEDLLP